MSDLTYRLLWSLGVDIHMQGRPLSDCLTRPEREGWQAMEENEKRVEAYATKPPAKLHVLMVGKLSAEGYCWSLSPLPKQQEEQPVDEEAQRLIDEAQMTLDYADYLEDVEFWRKGC